MQLTAEQKQSLQRGEAVPVLLEETPCVVLRRDVYDRLRPLISDSEIDVKELYPLVNDAMRDDDALDPWLESYQEFRP